ncbi:carboxypeptidase regulatory-like domain-containing protein [Diaminobutyricibacter sp. McL0618]|uniref:carboxypeptidase regulatory-like domain-containing protein n=1 Tax=Leifsonia sp. McL0618 TaxID=3415677 RepID=UPI003CE99DEA
MRKLSRLAISAVLTLGLAVGVLAVPTAAFAVTAPATTLIRGFVTVGPDKRPAAAGEVSISYEFSTDDATWGVPQATDLTTGANSVFGSFNMPVGYYRVTVTDLLYPGLLPFVGIIDATNPSSPYLEVNLTGATSISGTVQLNDQTNANPGPATAGEVRVYLWELANGRIAGWDIPSVLTDASGSYSFAGLDTADTAYTLEFAYAGSSPSYTTVWWGGSDQSTAAAPIAAPGSAVPTLDFTIPFTNTVAGTVVDSASQPVAGVTVCVFKKPSPWPQPTSAPHICEGAVGSAITDASGHYAIGRLADADYSVAFSPPATYSTQLWQGRNTFLTPTLVSLSGQKLVSGIDVTLLKDDTITTSISVNGLTAAQAASVGHGSVDVQQLDPTTDAWVDSNLWNTSDASGHYTITSLLPGTYRVDLKFTDKYGGSVHQLSAPVTLAGEGQTTAVSASLLQPIRPGATVKTATSSTVYLVDGASRLVPVDSMTTLSDIGFSTKPVTYAASRLASYTITSGHLSNAIQCANGQQWIGGSGMLNAVFDGTGLPKTAPGLTRLEDSTCAVPPKSTSGTYSIPPVVAVHGDPTVYMIGSDGKKHAYLNEADLRLEDSYDPIIIWTSSYYLNRIVTGSVHIPAGHLVKTTTSSSIYVVDGQSRLLPLTSFAIAADAGISMQIETVTPSQISGYTVASTPFRNVFVCLDQTLIAGAGHLYVVNPALVAAVPQLTLDVYTCDGIHAWNSGYVTFNHALFVKSASSSTIYYIDAAGQKQRVFSMATVAKLSAPDPARYLTASDAFLATLPNGIDLVTAGLLVKPPTSTSVYVVDGGGGLIPLRSFTTATDLGLSSHYVTVTAATMKTLSVAPAALNNLVSCAGADYIGGAGKLWSIDPSAVGSLAVSSLPASLCTVLPKSADALGTAVFIKAATSATVYTLEGGVKHPVSAWATLVRLAAGKPVTVLSLDAGFVARIPLGAVRT